LSTSSIRSLVRQLGLSAATVFLALRDSTYVVQATQNRVLKASHLAHYRPNTLVGSVVSLIRRSMHRRYQGNLMAMNYSIEAEPVLIPFHCEILSKAKQRT